MDKKMMRKNQQPSRHLFVAEISFTIAFSCYLLNNIKNDFFPSNVIVVSGVFGLLYFLIDFARLYKKRNAGRQTFGLLRSSLSYAISFFCYMLNMPFEHNIIPSYIIVLGGCYGFLYFVIDVCSSFKTKNRETEAP